MLALINKLMNGHKNKITLIFSAFSVAPQKHIY